MTRKCNLMILDNSGIDYSRIYYLCLVFLFTGKLNQILAPLATPGLRLDYKPVRKTKCDVKDNNF